jgi:hypothetical protein
VKVILFSCVRIEDILHESAECANRIRPSALHVIILPTLKKEGNLNLETLILYNF